MLSGVLGKRRKGMFEPANQNVAHGLSSSSVMTRQRASHVIVSPCRSRPAFLHDTSVNDNRRKNRWEDFYRPSIASP